MFEAWYLENGEIPVLVGKYGTRADAAAALAAKEQIIVKVVNPYWVWIEEKL